MAKTRRIFIVNVLTGRGEQPSGDGIRPVHLQGPPDHHGAGDAGEGAGRPAASLRGHHPGQRPGGRGQTGRSGAGDWNVPLPAGEEGRIHLRHVQVGLVREIPGWMLTRLYYEIDSFRVSAGCSKF